MKYSFILLLSFYVCTAFAQRAERYTISGFMRDSLTTESLISATVYSQTNHAGTTTNQFGFYSLTLPAGEVELLYSYVGYITQTFNFQLRRDTVIHRNLSDGQFLEEVAIIATRTLRGFETTQMSTVSLPMAQMKSLPALMGETDVIKILQLMPGIQSGGEGSAELHVRGGGSGQNLILLDGVPVYNVSHLFGFVSLFNGDAINSFEAYKGGFPARYGGRASSVIDISMKEGNMQKFSGEGAIGLLLSKLTLEGPIVKDRASFIVSARRSYMSWLLNPFTAMPNISSHTDLQRKKQGAFSEFSYYFYDLTAKINYRISDKDRIYLSAYMGDDKYIGKNNFVSLRSEELARFTRMDYISGDKLQLDWQWGNITTALRWNHIFTNRLFSNITLSYSRYRDQFVNRNIQSLSTFYYTENYNEKGELIEIISLDKGTTYQKDELENFSGINDWTGRIAFDYLPSPNHHIRFGAGAIYHTFNPGRISIRDSTGNRDYGASHLFSYEYSAYVEDDFNLTSRLKTNIGLHWSAFSVRNEFYNVFQPRISARYLISPQFSAKASYTRMAQYIHMLPTSFSGLPRDFWVPTTRLTRPQTADQIALGVAHNYRDDYEFSLEGYYKKMADVLEYKDVSSFLIMDDAWEENIVQGTGTSYGMELFVQKKTGIITGWAGYMLSWTDRHFDDLNNGKPFPYTYDRRHDLSISLKHSYERLNYNNKRKTIEFSATWIFSSGSYMTLPIDIINVTHPVKKNSVWLDTFQYREYSERNGYRMNPYHRLDVSVAFVGKTKRGEQRCVLNFYNAYNRKNPYFVTLEETAPGELRFIQYSLFPIIPSISYHFKF